MAFKMAKGSLFAVLLRSPWWYSVLIGLFFIAISMVVVGGQYVVLGLTGALPFFGIGAVAGYKQSKLPSPKRVLEVVEQSKKMPASQIAAKIAEGYIQANFQSAPFKGNAADIELTRGSKKLLLSSKRFKAANAGIDPFKQLVAAGENAEATGYLFVALGEISVSARSYADQNSIEIIQAERLAAFFDGQANIELT